MRLASPKNMIIFSALFISAIFSHVSHAGNEKNEESMDELMLGFDEPAPLTAAPNNGTAEDTELDDLLGGFDEELDPHAQANTEENSLNEPEKSWDLTTLLSISSSYSYQQPEPVQGQADFTGLSRLKFKLLPELRYKFNENWDSVFSISTFYDAVYFLKDRNTYTKENLDMSENELEVRELYLRGTLTDAIDIKFGRQIVVWGKSDSLRVVDILNPLDFREPGMVDIEDLRLPVTMLKTDYYTGDWNISMIIIPEIRFNKMPAYGSDFYLGGNNRLPTEIIPEDIKNPEYALAFIGNFVGWDLSLHFANYYDDQPHFVKSQPPSLEHSRLSMMGVATNVAKGSWLFKSEAAYIDGLQFSNSAKDFARADAMIGVDYNGIVDMIFSIEASNRRILAYDPALGTNFDNTQENESQISLRHNANFIHDKLKATTLITFFGRSPNDGGFYRTWLNYEIEDGMSIIIGGIIYQAGDSQLLKSMAKNDRVFIDYRYTF